VYCKEGRNVKATMSIPEKEGTEREMVLEFLARHVILYRRIPYSAKIKSSERKGNLNCTVKCTVFLFDSRLFSFDATQCNIARNHDSMCNS
jgi:hypothetical protein